MKKSRSKKFLSRTFSKIAIAGTVPVVAFATEFASITAFRTEHTASALTYQENINLQFTFNPSISLSLGGDLIIDNLAPGSASDSNIIDVSAGSNNPNGYKLYATVGNESHAYTDLRISSSDSDHVFTSITNATTDLANFSDNKWGYAYSIDSGNSWINGNYDESTSGYGILPLYNTTGVKLAETSDSAGTSNLKFKIGAKASNTQASGTYKNIINFSGVANIVTTNYTIDFIDDDGEVTTMPTDESGTTTNAIVTIPSQIPTRNGLNFIGWCTEAPLGSHCPGNLYRPGESVILADPSSNPTLSLHATWDIDTISFKIQRYHLGDFEGDPKTYYAENGMTWSEWLSSKYNTTRNDYTEGSYDILMENGNHICYYEHIIGGRSGFDCDYGTLYTTGYWENGGTYTYTNETIIENWTYNFSTECLTGDHLITMGDGTEKRLDEIQPGDTVLSYDWDTLTLIPKEVIFSDADEGKTHTEYDKWTFSDGTIIKTVHRHEFYNLEAKRFKYMDEWQLGEHTYKKDGTTPSLVTHETIKKTVRHYKITLKGGTNFFANGLLTGDRKNPHDIELA